MAISFNQGYNVDIRDFTYGAQYDYKGLMVHREQTRKENEEEERQKAEEARIAEEERKRQEQKGDWQAEELKRQAKYSEMTREADEEYARSQGAVLGDLEVAVADDTAEAGAVEPGVLDDSGQAEGFNVQREDPNKSGATKRKERRSTATRMDIGPEGPLNPKGVIAPVNYGSVWSKKKKVAQEQHNKKHGECSTPKKDEESKTASKARKGRKK
jgi:hypothetical protein